MYHNPVNVTKTNNWREKCSNFQKKLNIHNPLIITSKGNLSRQNLSSEFNSEAIISDVKTDPTFESCQQVINCVDISRFDGVVAIGGGSVMDTAKVVMAYMGTGTHELPELLKFNIPFRKKVRSIFIPTTHGTGSEVTMWGTIWDMSEKNKYSISHPDLYPSVAILDANLTLSLPLDISIITIMDALSHGFEAIWNNNANPTSTTYATDAITMIIKYVDALKKNPDDVKIRNKILIAANKAGLAFSNTQTAAAHSISYPLTQLFGIPHGIASSISLIPLLKINLEKIQNEINNLLELICVNNVDELIQKIEDVPSGIIKYSLKEWGIHYSDFGKIIPKCFTANRMDNNIIPLTREDVMSILYDMYNK